MAQRESKRSRQILKMLRARGGFWFKVHGSEYMMAGLPDIIGCYRGFFVGFEVKHPETRDNTSPRQEYVLSKIQSAGGFATVVCTKEEAYTMLDAIDASLHNRDDLVNLGAISKALRNK